ncbi:MAG: hypothetical protein HYY40_02500 [Bacteroidetes bacterium]|nr:hypothetical protein [Bacteroidota bacterium]
MSEVMAKKAKNAKKENEEFGFIEPEEGGMTLFISMTGTVDNPVFKYDKKAAFVKMKEDLKEEKQELKTILHEEFGLFKKDSTVKKEIKSEKNKDPFIYEWE